MKNKDKVKGQTNLSTKGAEEMKPIIYPRVSTTPQESGYSLMAQIQKCKEYAKAKGFKLPSKNQILYSKNITFAKDVEALIAIA